MKESTIAKFEAADAALDDLYNALRREGRIADTPTWKEYRKLRAELFKTRAHLHSVRVLADNLETLAGGH